MWRARCIHNPESTPYGYDSYYLRAHSSHDIAYTVLPSKDYLNNFSLPLKQQYTSPILGHFRVIRVDLCFLLV